MSHHYDIKLEQKRLILLTSVISKAGISNNFELNKTYDIDLFPSHFPNEPPKQKRSW